MTRFKDPRSAAERLRSDMLAQDSRRRTRRRDLAEVADAELPRRNDLLPRLRLEQRSPSALKTPKRNVRAVEPAHVREVANAITVFGFSQPVLIDEDGTIIDGIVSIEAAKLLGLTSVPCVVAGHLSPDERRLLRITLNKLGENGSWSFEDLKCEFEELVILEQPIKVSGFDPDQIDGFLSVDGVSVVESGPVEPDPALRPVTRLGDAYRLGPHRIRCGDARDPAVLRRLMGEATVRMVFTDQPYNVAIAGNVTRGSHREFVMASGEMSDAEFGAFNDAWIGASLPYLVDGGVLATFIDWRGLGAVSQAALSAGLSQINLVVWGKTNAGMGSLYRSQHELLPIFKKGDAAHVNNVELGRKGRHRSNLWIHPGASTQGSDARRGLQHHPTVKPAAMLVEALYDLTLKGEVVLDPFLGSGSTLIASETAGRICYGLELEPRYVDVIIRRYQSFTGQKAVLESSGETFAALEQRRADEADEQEPVGEPATLVAVPGSVGSEMAEVPTASRHEQQGTMRAALVPRIRHRQPS